MIYYLCNGDYMIVRDKDKFIKKLFIYRWFIFTKFSTDIDDMELSIIINALVVSRTVYNRYKDFMEFKYDEKYNELKKYFE